MTSLHGRVLSVASMMLPTAGLVVALWLSPTVAEGQAFRGWAGTSVQSIELRPIGLATVPRSEVLTDAEGRFLYEGQEVSCVGQDECTGYLALAEDRSTTLTQDLGGTAWGFGVQGLSFTTLVRARARLGGQLPWPRSDDPFDALLAYGQLDRGAVRVRAGRQEVISGLGFPAFDGLSAAYRYDSYRFEVYGGRSLARGLREPARDALRGLEDFFVDRSVVLFGAGASGRWLGSSVTARYHREIMSDRSSLVGDRASLDFSTVLPRTRVTGSLDYDFSFERVGKAELAASMPLRGGRWLLELHGRRYVPYFDLSTIWGFFEPVSYTEVLAKAGWSPSPELGAWVSGGRRRYGDTGTSVVLRPLSDSGWRADAGALWRPAPGWSVTGDYQLEWGPGGFLNSVDVAARYEVSDGLAASFALTSFQQIEEYRLGDGRAFGASATVDYGVSSRGSVLGGLSLLRHQDGGSVFTSPWNQSRVWTALRIELGRDPGSSGPGAGR